MFGELKKAAGTAWDVVKAPGQTILDVATKGKSVAGSLEDQWGGIDERHGLSKGWNKMTGQGGGGGGQAPGINYYDPKPGDFYVDPTLMMQTGGGGIVGGANVNDPSYLYEQAAGKWFDYGIDPKGQLADKYTYDPTLIDETQLHQMEAMDFDPQRSRAMGDLAAASSSGLQSALSQQAAAGGLTAADRMALASSFNRQRMSGEADLLGQFGVAEAQNIWETDQANKELLNKAYLQNLETANQADLMNMQTLMGQQEKADARAMDMYEKDLQRRMARELGGEVIGAPPAPTPTITPTPTPAPKPKPKPKATRSTPRRGRSTSNKLNRNNRMQAFEA